MPNIIDLRKRYESQIFQNGSLKQICDKMASDASGIGPRRGSSRLFQPGIEDSHIRNSAACWRRVMKYHEGVGNLTRKRLKGQRVSLNQEMALIRLGANVESDYHQAIRSAFAGIRSNIEITQALVSATLETVPVKHIPLLAHPTALTKKEVAALKFAGISIRNYRRRYHYLAKAENFDIQNFEKGLRLIESENLEARLREVESSFEEIPFSESPRNLVKQDVITFGGDEPTSTSSGVALASVAVSTPVVVAVVSVVAVVIIGILIYDGGQRLNWW